MQTRQLLTAIALTLCTACVMAQTHAPTTVQRDINQQSRIEQGLQNGSLTTREAGRLEKEQTRIDQLQARDLKDGNLSPAEKAQLQQAQNRASRDIKAAGTNGAVGNPDSASSQRMQADVARNVAQEKRIGQGLQSGQLTHKEAARLERGQARTDHHEAVAARDGHVSAREQARLQRQHDRQSKKIFKQKHDAQQKG